MRATLETVVCPGCGIVCRNWSDNARHGRYSKDCTPEMRFWARVNKNTPSGCWIWTGCVDKWGYGDISYLGKHVQAHRLSWRLLRGEPTGFHVLHKCNTPPCCNPDHLYLGTDADNTEDKRKAGTILLGEKAVGAVLSNAIVIEARKLYWCKGKGKGSNIVELAAKFKVPKGSLYCAITRRSWKHIP